jgi:hypothetical protein
MASTPREHNLDVLQAMRKQQEKAYRISTVEVETQSEYSRWCTQMVGWCYRTAEVYGYPKEYVEIAMPW